MWAGLHAGYQFQTMGRETVERLRGEPEAIGRLSKSFGAADGCRDAVLGEKLREGYWEAHAIW